MDAGTSSKLFCFYDDRYCTCAFIGGAQPGWKCLMVIPSCPVVPPDEGDPCTPGASDCPYYPCSKSARCTDGHWHWELITC